MDSSVSRQPDHQEEASTFSPLTPDSLDIFGVRMGGLVRKKDLYGLSWRKVFMVWCEDQTPAICPS